MLGQRVGRGWVLVAVLALLSTTLGCPPAPGGGGTTGGTWSIELGRLDCDDYATYPVQASDGNYFVHVGCMGQGSQRGYWTESIVKLSPDGKQMWAPSFANALFNQIYATSDGGCLIDASDGLYRFDSKGKATKLTLPTDLVEAGKLFLDITPVGNEYVCVQNPLFSGSPKIVKLDSTLKESWTYLTSAPVYFLGRTKDGGLLFVTQWETVYHFIKLGQNGQELSTTEYGGDNENEGVVPLFGTVSLCSDDGFLIDSYIIREAESENRLGLARLDKDFNKLWFYETGASPLWLGSGLYWNRIRPTSDGGAILAGMKSVASGICGVLTKVDGDGNEVWSREYYGNGRLIIKDVAIITGGYLLAGITDTGQPNCLGRGWVAKVDAQGES